MKLPNLFKGRASIPQVAPEGGPLPVGVTIGQEAAVKFIGQPKGSTAEIFERSFRAALVPFPFVKKAYLCKIRYRDDDSIRAAICLVAADGDKGKVVEALSAVIRSTLDQCSNMDILFLSNQDEAQLAPVYKAFYVAV